MRISNFKFQIPLPGLRTTRALFMTLFIFAFSSISYASETVITADVLNYDSKTSTYRAEGSVRILAGEARLEARSVLYEEKTSVIFASGGVIYEDPEVFISAERLSLDMERKTGFVEDAYVFVKKGNLHIRGREMRKRGEGRYRLTEASFTTCDSAVPEWSLSGQDISLTLGDFVSARNATFSIKGVSVFYTPYVSAPLLTERKTGLLIPTAGFSSLRGFTYEQPFFWAIAENRDATFAIDLYAKRGVGESVEYRYVEEGGIEGEMFIHHIRDSEIDKDLIEFRGVHGQENLFLDLNLVNSREFFRLYKPYLETGGQRFLESDAEASVSLGGSSRIYLTGRFVRDLAGKDKDVPQKLPEAGFFLEPVGRGPFVFGLSASVANFITGEENAGGEALRADIYPRLSHSIGKTVTFHQSAGLRQTAYGLKGSPDIDRRGFNYEANLGASLLRDFGKLRHIVEPSAYYSYVEKTGEEPPLLDSLELIGETSSAGISLMNRLMDEGGEFLALRISTGVDLKTDSGALRAEMTLRRPVSLRADFSYEEGSVESVNSALELPADEFSLSAGQRYDRSANISLLSFGLRYSPKGSLSAEGALWYDEEEGRISNLTAGVRIKRQCWGLSVSVSKKPDDLSFFISIDILGLGALKV